MLTAVVGINWGDEGKGRMVDLLCADYDVVVRYQGGNNAGHTVINDQGRFILNLLPSGMFNKNTVNVCGPGMVIDLAHLAGEIRSLRERGVAVTPDNLRLSGGATICLPFHAELDALEEDRLAGAKQGSTRRGIAPAYADKYMRKALRLDDLRLSDAALRAKVDALVEWKNITVEKGYGRPPISADATFAWLREHGDFLKPFLADVGAFLDDAAEQGRRILFEAQLGALRDLDFGIYPYTTSSSAIAAYAPIGAGIPARRLDAVVGIIKAYSSSVGGGPFTVEWLDAEGDRLRGAGGEYGASTGRPRRVGPFDAVASRYGVRMQGATALALTKLDVLAYLDKIPVCVAYDVDGERTADFPSGERLLRAKPVIEYLDGFKRDISGARKPADLPAAARAYIDYIADTMRCPVKYCSVGPDRDAYVELR